MRGIVKVEPLVLKALETAPATRNSDALLYLYICKMIYPNYGKLSTEDAILRRKEYGLPKFESVGRCRRKLQERNEELRATEEVINERYEGFKAVLEYVQE